MEFRTTKIGKQPEILKRKLGGELFVAASFNGFFEANPDAVMIPAGVRVVDHLADERQSGGQVNGILLNDVYRSNPHGSVVVAFANVCVGAMQDSMQRLESLIGINSSQFNTSQGTLEQGHPLIVFDFSQAH